MPFIKLGESIDLELNSIQDENSVISSIDPQIVERFAKFASNLKKIAPKANDFLYFSGVMMHAAEAAAINEDGTPKLTKSGEPVKVGWEVSNGTYKWFTNDASVKPYKNCFVPGTEILMEDGSIKDIENIEPGDFVITHLNRPRKVLKKFITPHEDKILKIKIKNNQSIKCTDNHKFYHANLDAFYTKGLKGITEKKKNNKNYNTSYKFSKASELTVGDLLLSPVVKSKLDSNLNENRARLLGIYAAEGSFGKKYNKRQSVKFTIGGHETKQAQLIKNIFEEEFPECSVTINNEPSRNIIEVTATGENISEYFYYHCGEYSHTKKLSKELVYSSDNIRKSFLCGYIDGDGCLVEDYNKLILITVSPHLANQVRLMLNSMNISNSLRKIYVGKTKCSINKNYGEYPRKDLYRVELYGDAYKKLNLDELTVKYTFGNFTHKNLSNFEDDYCLHYVRSIEEEFYSGNVYNIEVEEDHSYVANGVVVSNCNNDIFPESELIKAHKKWIGKPLCLDHKSSSVDHTKGFIVDTYYDYKLKRVIALCALDKLNEPELARKVSSMMQTALSMGTAVGKAICSDCGTVAKTEADFCNHMRYKTCYGEINIDLNPIELSLVVNPADTRAHIKHVIAAAQNLNSYVERKNDQLKKIADKYNATLSFSKESDSENSKSFNYDIKTDDLDSFKKDLEKVIEKYENLSSSVEKDLESIDNSISHQTESSVSMPETDMNGTDFSLSPPHQRFASVNEEIQDVRVKLALIHDNILKMQENLNKLSYIKNVKQEEIMSESNLNKKSYFQGGGGVNEPTPGQVKYPKDPMNEDLRDSEDRQMVGQPPFPNVGPVDEMYPGVGDKSDLEVKKMHARAQAEERALKRAKLISKVKETLDNKKVSYFLGGGDVNEPTPGKTKYAPDPLEMQLRNKEDKQMVGQKPFPDVGKVDGLHPSPDSVEISDELQRKEMLSRANKIRAKFVKAARNDGSLDLGNSGWELFLGNRFLVKASVQDLTGGNSSKHYSVVATKECGSDLINRVRALGVSEGVVSLFRKNAQDAAAPPATPALPAAPAPSASPAQPDMASEKVTDDSGKEGDPKETAVELSEKVRDLSSDLHEAVKALTGEQDQMGDVESMTNLNAADDDKVTTAALQSMRAELNPLLIEACEEAIETLSKHDQELTTIAEMYDNGAVNTANKDYVSSLVNDSFIEAQASIVDGLNLLGGFVRYARGTEALIKRASEEVRMSEKPDHDMEMMHTHDHDTGEGLMSLVDDSDKSSEHEDSLDAMLMSDLHSVDDEDEDDSDDDYESSDSNDVVMVPDADTAAEVSKKAPGTSVEVKKASTKESRSILRAKLAADMKWNPILEESHKHVSGPTFDVKPSGDLGKVETVEEKHSAMMNVFNAPPKVRKEAEVINQLISEGTIKVEDLPKLVSEGLDPEAVKYWKQLFGEMGSDGSEFATELVKEHVKAQYEEDKNLYKVKIARAYEMAYEMSSRGLIGNDREAISNQVDQIMQWNDESFSSVKKIIASYSPMNKTAGVIPQVGLLNSFDQQPSNEGDMVSLFKAAFSKSGKMGF